MSLRKKVHIACVLGIVLCEAQTAAMKYFAEVLAEAGKSRYVD